MPSLIPTTSIGTVVPDINQVQPPDVRPAFPTIPDIQNVPDYDRLDLGFATVIYPQCDQGVDSGRLLIIIIHEESGSAAFLDPGSFNASTKNYLSEEGKTTIERVLSDTELMTFVLERTARPSRCPSEYTEVYFNRWLSVPETDRFIIDEDTVARFLPCEDLDQFLFAPIVVIHLPTESIIGIKPGVSGTRPLSFGTPSGQDYLAQVLSDDSLVAKLEALVPREARCG